MDIPKKRSLLTLLLAVLFALGLTACGTGREEAANGATGGGAEKETPPSSRMYTDALGRKVEIPSEPKRIAAHFYAPEMVSLNSRMVGTNFANARLVLKEEQLKGVEDIGGQGSSPSLEKVLALAPDLIIVPDFLDAAALEALSKIAPTVTMPYSGDVFSRIKALGDMIGKQDEAAAWIKRYKDKAEQKKKEIAPIVEKGQTASAFVVFQDKQLYVYGPQRLGPIMYDALGFKAPEAVNRLFAAKENENKLWVTISMEKLPELAGDHIFLVTQDANDASRKGVEELIQNSVWKNLPAVKNGQAYVVSNRWAFNDSVTLEWLLDEMPKVLKP
ncbi:ABC transporter substrate-binding protein [Paenibacillus sp. GYB003]|uniref:ABC transporter substrate-binding protein n=1 Tax=Paenibacillus sp. GYB003 TaxID=2994392 RepID=UPI002F962BF8